MGAKRTHDAVATIGKYKDAQGNEKKRFLTVGSVFTDDQGRMSLKLDAVPTAQDWSGFISFYPVEKKQSNERQSPPVAKKPASKPPVTATADDDVPF